MTITPSSHAQRLDLAQELPDAYDALIRLDGVAAKNLDPRIYELVKLRASQINGCAFCMDMHARDARAHGEDQRRLDVLPGWREVTLFDEREQAALALCEAVTRLADGPVSDAVWDAAAAVFPPQELAALLTACIIINSWNRVAVPTQMPLPEAG